MDTPMTDVHVIPELKQIIGSLLFAARQPMTVQDIKKVLKDTAESADEPEVKAIGDFKPRDIEQALKDLDADLRDRHTGLHVGEVANGYRIQNDASCGRWLRTMLDKGRTNRLTKPSLETLAIIAYRQPCTRSEIEAVRGVSVDQVVRNLVDLQLVKVVGRSDMPGRPWLFGTTQKFLEYFGLRDLKDLPGIDELRRIEMERKKTEAEAAVESEEEAQESDAEEIAAEVNDTEAAETEDTSLPDGPEGEDADGDDEDVFDDDEDEDDDDEEYDDEDEFDDDEFDEDEDDEDEDDRER